MCHGTTVPKPEGKPIFGLEEAAFASQEYEVACRIEKNQQPLAESESTFSESTFTAEENGEVFESEKRVIDFARGQSDLLDRTRRPGEEEG